MTTYKNVTNLKPILDGKVVNPGQLIHTLSYRDEDEVGLRLVDDKPYYNPILLSECITKPGTIVVPAKDSLGKFVSKYSIHLCVEKGSVRILYNSVENTPALLLYTGAKWNTRHFERNVEKIIVQNADESGNYPIVYVIIEKLA